MKKELLALSERYLPYTLYRYIMILYQRVTVRNKECSYEDEYFLKWRPFSKKKYCIIRVEFPVHSVFVAAKRYIFAAEYARHHGMYPIMDLEWRSDFKKGILAGENMWGSMVYQKKGRKVLTENATIFVCRVDEGANWNLAETCADINKDPKDNNIHAKEENWRDYYRNIHKYVRKYWRFNHHIIYEADKKAQEFFQQKKKILGVALRENFSGEFYAQLRNMSSRKVYRNHPQNPDINEILEIVATCLEEWKCDKIFVASIYSDSIKKFEDRFPGKIIYCDRERMSTAENIDRINSSNKFINDSMAEDQEFRARSRRIGIEYAQETILLSKCDYLIGAKSGQTLSALSLNGGRYKDIKVLEDRRHIYRY